MEFHGLRQVKMVTESADPNEIPTKSFTEMLNLEISNPGSVWEKLDDVAQINIINDAVRRYPYSADENMEILCDNGTLGSVNIRVFMSIRKLYHRKLQSLMLEHKDALMKKEAEWLTKMENEKIELGKQISIRDQMVLEARAETNEYKSMNQSILSQISDKEAKIAQVSFYSLGLVINPSSEFELRVGFNIYNLYNIISGCQSNRPCSNNSNARDNETDGKGKRRNWKGISNKSLNHKI